MRQRSEKIFKKNEKFKKILGKEMKKNGGKKMEKRLTERLKINYYIGIVAYEHGRGDIVHRHSGI